MSQKEPIDLFPFSSFRKYQEDALQDALEAIRNGKNIILDLPTGIGKSPINIALCNDVDSAYYTTPQRELRLQLRQDDDLSDDYHVLQARGDYVCDETGEKCDKCYYYTDIGETCNEAGRACTYMDEIVNIIRSDTGVLTMSRLLISGQKKYNSFLKPRELMIVDEAQSLEDQVAGMHANVEIRSGKTVPGVILEPVIDEIEQPEASEEDEDKPVLMADEIMSEISTIRTRLSGYIDHHGGDPNKVNEVLECKNIQSKLSYFYKEIDEDRDWVVNVYNDGIELKPMRVDKFLRHYFWSQANQIVLSTATVPYRGDEERWLSQLGLNADNFEVISYPSPFPELNRLVHTRHEIGKMSQKEDEVWDTMMSRLNELSGKHQGQKGLIHTASYGRAHKLVESAKSYHDLDGNIMADRQGESTIEEWQNSDIDIMCSPSMTEGISLDGEKCEWQVLLKVPYPHPDDARVRKMLQDDRWYWYNQKAGVKVLQSVGRAVRSKDDKANFYVFDSSFEDVRRSVTFPEWFEEAIC